MSFCTWATIGLVIVVLWVFEASFKRARKDRREIERLNMKITLLESK